MNCAHQRSRGSPSAGRVAEHEGEAAGMRSEDIIEIPAVRSGARVAGCDLKCFGMVHGRVRVDGHGRESLFKSMREKLQKRSAVYECHDLLTHKSALNNYDVSRSHIV